MGSNRAATNAFRERYSFAMCFERRHNLESLLRTQRLIDLIPKQTIARRDIATKQARAKHTSRTGSWARELSRPRGLVLGSVQSGSDLL